MKILILIQKYNLNIKKDYTYTFPLGLAYISSVLKKEKYDVDCFNMNHYEGTSKDILTKKLDSKKYDIVCLGGNALDYPILELLIKTIKLHKTKPIIVLGGPVITTETELIFKSLKPNFGVIGEGEETIVELVNAISKKLNYDNIQGIIYSKKNKIIITQERKGVNDLDSLPLPDYEGFGFEEKLENTYTNDSLESTLNNSKPRVYPILASRSCPFQCTFCYHQGNFRIRKMKNVIDEIRYAVKKYKISVLSIYDDCFSSNKERLLEFCKEITKLQKELTWELSWGCQLIVNTVDEKMLKIMKDSGCVMISYGFESFSTDVLKSMKKYITPKQIDFAFKSTLKQKIVVQANFIFGDIAETKETSKITLDYWEKNCEGQVYLRLIQPYPGSQIYNYCVDKGLIKDRMKFIKSGINQFYINMTKNMTEKEFIELKNKLIYLTQKHSVYVVPKNKINNGETQSLIVKCPFCNKKNEYNHCKIKNNINYGFQAACRHCYKRYDVVSIIRYIVNKRLRFLLPYYFHIKTGLTNLKIKLGAS